MSDIMKKIVLTIVVFLTIVLTGFLLICGVYLLPTDRVQLHVRESGTTLMAEGDYWWMIQGNPRTILDNFTDSIMLATVAYQGEESLTDKAVNNYKVFMKDKSKEESLQSCGLIPDELQNKSDYARYWHGYMVVLKPLLMFFNISEIRQLNQFVVLCYIAVTCLLLYYHRRIQYVVPYLLGVCSLTPFTVANSMQNSTVFHTMSIAVIVLLVLWEREKFREKIWLFFLLTGMVTSYVDFLTYPVVSLAFPIIFYFILAQEDKLFSNAGKLVLYSGMWSVGYVGMWASKWLLSSVLTGENYLTKALQKMDERSGNMVGEVEINYRDVIEKMSGYMHGYLIGYLTVLFILICFIILFFVKKRWNGYAMSLMFLILSGYPFVWWFGAKNHSYIHDMFTHRGWSVVIFGISCCVLPLLQWPIKKK